MTDLLINGKFNLSTSETAFYLFCGPLQYFLAKYLLRGLHISFCTVLRSEIPSGMCAKLRTVAASNNRDHPTRSLCYCLFAPHTYILFFAHIPLVVNHTINATPPERLQQQLAEEIQCARSFLPGKSCKLY